MKKSKLIVLIGTLIIGVLTLTGCSINSVAEAEKRFVYVYNEGDFTTYYDKETLVMYAVSNGSYNRGTVTLLVDAEGKPLLYK